MTPDRLGRNLHRLTAIALLAATLAVYAQPAPDAKWPWYGPWEAARFAAFPPLIQSVLARDEDAALRLIDDGYTPLSLAVRKKEAKVVSLLVAAIPHQRYNNVAVAEQVWIASYSADTATLRALLEAGVPPDYIAPQGNSALISAVDDTSLERVELLLKHGATVDDHRYRGRNIFEIARAKLSIDNPDALRIVQLIEAAPRSASNWKKSAEVERIEAQWKMINGK